MLVPLSEKEFDPIGLKNPSVETLRQEVQKIRDDFLLMCNDGEGGEIVGSIPHLVVVVNKTPWQKFWSRLFGTDAPEMVSRVYLRTAVLYPQKGISERDLTELAVLLQSLGRKVRFSKVQFSSVV